MSGWDDEEFDEGEDFEEWDGKFSRKHLKVDRLYYEQPTGMYFYTPDGVGCLWFDTKEEALEEVGDFGQPIITLVQELSDF